MVVYGAVAIEASSEILLPRFLRFVGDASYSIYLSHVLVISAIGRFWAKFFIPGKMDNVLVMIVMACVALSVGIGSYLTMERLLPSIFRRLGTMLFRSQSASEKPRTVSFFGV